MIQEIIDTQNTLNQLNVDFDKVSIEFDNMNNATKILKLSKLYKINTRKNILVQVINLALKDIFFDKELKIDIETNETSNTALGYNVQYDFIIYKNGNELARNTDIYDSNGGGAISIISWVLKLLMSYLNNTGNFLAFDESFSQVSEKYLNSLSMFIRNICEKYDLYIILITHQNISEHAHLTYNLSGSLDSKGIDQLNVDRIDIRIDDVETIDDVVDCYYLKASNFQSIVELDLKVKGFTCILGDSDIGKTACVRAINSIINNDFNPNYKRIKTRGAVDVYFGYINSEKYYNKIHLSYKNSSVYYYLEDGTELKGKALAAERISDALYEFGFKQIDISAYKNWNSELKKQTQRLNVTTQHDKLYFSNERNATEKILTLLFNSQGFNIGITNGINSSRDLLNHMDSINSAIADQTEKLDRLNIELAQKKLALIETILDLTHIKIDKGKHLESTTQLIIGLESMINDIENNLKVYNLTESVLIMSMKKFNDTLKFEAYTTLVKDIISDVNVSITSSNIFKRMNLLAKLTSESITLKHSVNAISDKHIEIDIDNIVMLNSKLKKISTILSISDTIISDKQEVIDVDNKTSTTAATVNDMIALRNKYYMINKLLDAEALHERQLDEQSDRTIDIINISNDIVKYTSVKSAFITTHKVLQYFDKSTSIQSDLDDNNAGMDHIHSEYGLQECPHCLGVGLLPITK